MLETCSAITQEIKQSSMAARRKNQFILSTPLLLAIIVALSFMIRLAAWNYFGTGTIKSEGAEYAKIAENLRSGAGFVGLVVPGPQIHFPPLYPLLIAAASFLTGDYESAGRLVSLILGALLPLPVFGIAARLFNRTVAVIAAILSLSHPLLIYLSFMVLSEGGYATLLLSAIYLVIRALDESSNRLWLLIGAAFGLCYLFRAEALVAFTISVLFAFIAKGNFIEKGKRMVVAILVFSFFALPVVFFIYKSTGRLMLEAKSTTIMYFDTRILAAQQRPGVDFVSAGGLHDLPSAAPSVEQPVFPWPILWAYYAIDSELKETGFAMRPWAETARDERVNPKDVFSLLLAVLPKASSQLFKQLTAFWFGAPLLPLAILGVFRRPWRRPQAILRLYFTFITIAPVFATLFIFWGENPRYYFIFAPILSIWAANGLLGIATWTKASLSASGWDILARRPVYQWILPGLVVLAMIISAVIPVTRNFEFSTYAPPARVDKEIGLWIGRQQSRPIRVMDLTLPLSFHADAEQHVYFPYTTGTLALRYLDKAKVDYVVLRHGQNYTKYYKEWLEEGIPGPQAERLQLPPVPGAEGFVIYKWHREGT